MYQKTTLDNGLRVVTHEMPTTRSASTSVYIGVGSRYEPDEQAGISHFIEHLLFKGTRRRPTPREISATIEGVGGVLNAATEQELTVYWCKVAAPHFPMSLDLLIDMLRCSLFDSENIERERMVVFEELNMMNDHPDQRVDVLLDEMLWPGHPLGRDIAGSKDSVRAITRDMMLDYVGRYYTPSNTVVSVAGNVSHREAVDQVAALCDGWLPRSPQGWTPIGPVQPGPQSRVEYRKTEQAHLSIGVPGVSLEHPERYAVDLLSVVLGEGMSSRLFVEVREQLGLAYDIRSGVSHFLDCGSFVVTAGVDPRRLYEAMETILAQMRAVRDGVSEEELEKAKRLSTGRLSLRMEDTTAVSAWLGHQELLRGRILDADEVAEKVNQVTPEDVCRAANDLLTTDRLNVAVVGPCRGQRRLERLLKL